MGTLGNRTATQETKAEINRRTNKEHREPRDQRQETGSRNWTQVDHVIIRARDSHRAAAQTKQTQEVESGNHCLNFILAIA